MAKGEYSEIVRLLTLLTLCSVCVCVSLSPLCTNTVDKEKERIVCALFKGMAYTQRDTKNERGVGEVSLSLLVCRGQA